MSKLASAIFFLSFPRNIRPFGAVGDWLQASLERCCPPKSILRPSCRSWLYPLIHCQPPNFRDTQQSVISRLLGSAPQYGFCIRSNIAVKHLAVDTVRCFTAMLLRMQKPYCGALPRSLDMTDCWVSRKLGGWQWIS